MKKNEWAYAHQQGIVVTTTDTKSLPFLKFSKNQAVLDIGCGKGTLLKKLTEEFGVEGVGIDIVSTKPRNCAFIRAEAQNLPFKDRVFNIVYSLGVFEHLPHIEQAFFESSRVLRTNGQVLITVPNLFSLHTFLDRPLRQLLRLWQIGSEKSYSLSDVYDLMAKAGYQNVVHKLILWDLKKGSVLSKVYTRFDNFLNRFFLFWGFFVAISGVKICDPEKCINEA